MADKGFAPAQTTFPTLSFWGFGNFTPILFRLSELHLSAIKGWNSFLLLFWGSGMGAWVWWAALTYACLTGPSWAVIIASSVGSAFCWFLFGYGMGLWIAASGVLILTKLIVQQWRGRRDQPQLSSLLFLFCSEPKSSPSISKPW